MGAKIIRSEIQDGAMAADLEIFLHFFFWTESLVYLVIRLAIQGLLSPLVLWSQQMSLKVCEEPVAPYSDASIFLINKEKVTLLMFNMAWS